MNKPLDPNAPRLTEKAFLRRIGVPVPFEGRAAKEAAKHKRRKDRRAAIARKREWLDS